MTLQYHLAFLPYLALPYLTQTGMERQGQDEPEPLRKKRSPLFHFYFYFYFHFHFHLHLQSRPSAIGPDSYSSNEKQTWPILAHFSHIVLKKEGRAHLLLLISSSNFQRPLSVGDDFCFSWRSTEGLTFIIMIYDPRVCSISCLFGKTGPQT